MTGPRISVTLDAAAVAGLLVATEGVQDTAAERGFDELVEQMRSMRLALEGALRAHGWRPVGDGTWQQAAVSGR
jgi:hypothetical protein